MFRTHTRTNQGCNVEQPANNGRQGNAQQHVSSFMPLSHWGPPSTHWSRTARPQGRFTAILKLDQGGPNRSKAIDRSHIGAITNAMGAGSNKLKAVLSATSTCLLTHHPACLKPFVAWAEPLKGSQNTFHGVALISSTSARHSLGHCTLRVLFSHSRCHPWMYVDVSRYVTSP